MSNQSTSDVASACSSCESYDPFDHHHPKNDLAALFNPNDYIRAGPGGDIDALDPPIPLEIKEKVKAVDPCQGRCLITNATPDSGIKYTHCLSIHLSETSDLIHRLEWHWGMRMNELDLNSEYNIFPVSAQLSAMHEHPRRAPSWFLLPEDDILDKFFSQIEKFDVKREPCEVEQNLVHSKADRGNLPELREKTYKYRLFPMDLRMEGMSLYHVRHPPIHRPTLSDFTFDVYPFDNLPWVTSHLDPKFVIMEAGRKLDLMDGWRLKFHGAYQEFFNSHPSLRRLLLLYEAWSAPIPPDAYKDPEFISLAVLSAPAPTTDLNTVKIDTVDDRSNLGPSEYNRRDTSSVPDRWSVEAQDSKSDVSMGGGSRTPPRRLILSKDGKHWY